MGFRRDVQAVRGVAVLVVVAYHADTFVTGGFVGVDMFFVVSGFVIARMLLNELELEGRIDFRRFYLRRIRRLLPALAVLLSATLLMSVLFAPLRSQAWTAKTGVAAALVNANNYLAATPSGYFDPGIETNPLLHTWSLSLEEQFYLVFPAVLALAWTLSGRFRISSRRGVTVALCTIGAFSFLLGVAFTWDWLGLGALSERVAFYSAPARAWEFAIGGTLAAVSGFTRWASSRAIGRVLALASGWGLVVLATLTFDSQTSFPGIGALVPVMGTALLIAGGSGQSCPAMPRLISWRPLQRLGDLSYSWYLWHWPFIVFATATWPTSSGAKVGAAAVSLIPAWLSYRFVENPIRLKVSPLSRRTIAIACVSVAAPLAAAGILSLGTTFLEKNAELLGRADHHDCEDGDGEWSLESGRVCFWPDDRPEGTAVLIGDSNAWHFATPFSEASAARDYDALALTRLGCPFVDIQHPMPMHDPDGSKCEAFKSETTRQILDLNPEVIFVASASASYIENGSDVFKSPDSAQTFRTTEEKAAAWEAGVRRALQPFHDAAIPTVLVLRAPQVNPPLVFDLMSPVRLLAGNVAPEFSRRDALDHRRAGAAAERSGARGLANVIDPFDLLCPDEPCSTRDGGTWLYIDSVHISSDGARRVTRLFADSMSAVRDEGR